MPALGNSSFCTCSTQHEQWHCTAVLEGHERTVRSVAWSRRGDLLFSASFDATVGVWQEEGGVWEQVSLLEGHESEVKSVACNPRNDLVATCSRDKSGDASLPWFASRYHS